MNNFMKIENELMRLIIENKFYYWLNCDREMFYDKNIKEKIKITENAIKSNRNIQ